MGKKELKRDLKLYKSDLNSMAEESIFYRARAEKAEAMVESMLDTVSVLLDANVVTGAWIGRWYKHVYSWRAAPPKNYRSEDEL